MIYALFQNYWHCFEKQYKHPYKKKNKKKSIKILVGQAIIESFQTCNLSAVLMTWNDHVSQGSSFVFCEGGMQHWNNVFYCK